MIGFGWLVLRQAQEALRSGRLDEAHRLLGDPALRGQKRAHELLQQLARAFVDRAERHLRHEDAAEAWADLLRAEQLGVNEPALVRLRQALTRLGVAEIRAVLEAGEPGRAAEAVAQLRDRGARLPELDPLEEGAKDWVVARDLADRGEFAHARTTLERVRRLLPAVCPALERFHGQIAERERSFTALVVALHEAVEQARWREVVELSGQVLALAPHHPEARKARQRAWKAIEPATIVSAPARPEAQPAATADPLAHLLLSIDGVGGYLVCLQPRVTIGQATPDTAVDVPVFAEVSRLHAALTRDAEGYVFEAFRPSQVNGQPLLRGVLRSGDRVTLGTSCQFQFRLPVPLSASARLDLVSGHRLRLAVDGVVLMADTLVLGPGAQAHVQIPELRQPVILFRQRDGLGVRHAGSFAVNGQPARDRATVEPAAAITGDDFALALEPVSRKVIGH
jgi:hypothetical protein